MHGSVSACTWRDLIEKACLEWYAVSTIALTTHRRIQCSDFEVRTGLSFCHVTASNVNPSPVVRAVEVARRILTKSECVDLCVDGDWILQWTNIVGWTWRWIRRSDITHEGTRRCACSEIPKQSEQDRDRRSYWRSGHSSMFDCFRVMRAPIDGDRLFRVSIVLAPTNQWQWTRNHANGHTPKAFRRDLPAGCGRWFFVAVIRRDPKPRQCVTRSAKSVAGNWLQLGYRTRHCVTSDRRAQLCACVADLESIEYLSNFNSRLVLSNRCSRTFPRLRICARGRHVNRVTVEF